MQVLHRAQPYIPLQLPSLMEFAPEAHLQQATVASPNPLHNFCPFPQ